MLLLHNELWSRWLMLHQNLLINWVDAFLCDQSLSNIDLADRPDAVKSVFKLFEVLISLKG